MGALQPIADISRVISSVEAHTDFLSGNAAEFQTYATCNSGTQATMTTPPGNHPGAVVWTSALNTANSGWYVATNLGEITLMGGCRVDHKFTLAQTSNIIGRVGFAATFASTIATNPVTGVYAHVLNGVLDGKSIINSGTLYTTATNYTLQPPSTLTGVISNGVLTVTSPGGGAIMPGMLLSGTGVPLQTYVSVQLTGSEGVEGTYALVNHMNLTIPDVASRSMTGVIWYQITVKIGPGAASATYSLYNDLGTLLWQDTLTDGIASGTTRYSVGAVAGWVQASSGAAAAVATADYFGVMSDNQPVWGS